MEYKVAFNKKLQIASIKSKADWHDFAVHTLIQNPKQKRPAINAYLGARYSRSADSIIDIAKEVIQKGVDPSKRLESIFYGYGHKSVGDMADLFVCLENIPMWIGKRTFNINPVISGQERSTRFQNFSKPNFIKIPKEVQISDNLRREYSSIIRLHMRNYNEMLPKFESKLVSHFSVDLNNKSEKSALAARTFDTARYFLPMGLKTSLGIVMSARNFSEYISRLQGSGYIAERELGQLLFDLLKGIPELEDKGYIPEADMLVRHSDANQSRTNAFKDISPILDEIIKTLPKRSYTGVVGKDVDIHIGTDPVYILIQHMIALKNSTVDVSKLSESEDLNPLLNKIGQIMQKYHHHNDQLGNVGQMGSYQFDGYADLGTLKDLNRHRSMERFIPLWEPTSTLDHEFDKGIRFYACNYLDIPEFKEERDEYDSRMKKSYMRILSWYSQAKAEMGTELASEYGKYLLPYAHATRYFFYGSVDDLQYTVNLRSRPGGHISYRDLTYRWLELLKEQSPFWNGFYEKLSKVDPSSREQFVDRS